MNEKLGAVVAGALVPNEKLGAVGALDPNEKAGAADASPPLAGFPNEKPGDDVTGRFAG